MTRPKLTLDNPLNALNVFFGGYPTSLPRKQPPQSKDFLPSARLGANADRSAAARDKRLAARRAGSAKWRGALRQWNLDYDDAYTRFGAAVSIARRVAPKYMPDQASNYTWDDDAVDKGDAALRAGRVKFTKAERALIEEFALADVESLTKVAAAARARRR